MHIIAVAINTIRNSSTSGIDIASISSSPNHSVIVNVSPIAKKFTTNSIILREHLVIMLTLIKHYINSKTRSISSLNNKQHVNERAVKHTGLLKRVKTSSYILSVTHMHIIE